MKFEITTKPPVSPEHGITVGRVFERYTHPDESDLPHNKQGWWVMGDIGEPVRLWRREFKEVS